MPTKSAGRVSIRVVPDSTRFKQDLKKSLERIEKSTVVKIPAELEVRREQMLKLKRQIERLKITIRPKIELNVGLEEIFKVKEDIEAMRPKVEVELNTKAAASRLASLARTRVAAIVPVVMGTVGNLGRKVGALAGLNVVMDSLREGADFVNNLDRHAANIARIGTIVGGVVASLGALGGGLFVLGQDLSKIAGIGLLAPGFAIGAAIQMGVLVAVLKDMGDRLGDLKPAFSDLQDSMSNGFWEIAEKPIRNVVKALLPSLKEQLTNTAQGFGVWAREISDSMRKHITPKYLDIVFDRMNRGIARASGAMDPLIHAFAVLGGHSSLYFERFGGAIATQAKRFDKFISDASKDGRLKKWTDDAIQAMKDLGGITASTSEIFNAIGDAARKAGIGGLKEFRGALDKIEAFFESPRAQATMKTFFEGAKIGFDGLIQGIKNLGPGLESFMPTFKVIMGSVGRILAEIGTIVSKFLSNKEFQGGLEKFFDGIEKALEIMGPAVDPMAKSLGGLFDLMGKILPNIATLISQIMIKWGPAFDEILKALEPLIPDIVELAGVFIDELAPILMQAAKDILPPLVDLLKIMVPLFSTFVKLVTPIVATVLSNIANGLKLIAEKGEEFNTWARPGVEFLEKVAKFMKEFKLPPLNNLTAEIGIKVGWGLALAGFQGEVKKFIANLAITWALNVRAAGTVFATWGKVLGAQILKWLLIELPNWWNNEAVPKLQEWAKNLAKEVIRIILGKPSEADGETKAKADEFGKAVWDKVLLGIQGAYTLWKTRVKNWIDSINPFHDIMSKIFGDNHNPTLGGGVGSRSVPAKIMPSLLNEQAETTWLDTLKTNLDTKIGGLGAGIVTGIAGMASLVGPQWGGFFGGLNGTAQGIMPQVAGVVGTQLGIMNQNIGGFKNNALLDWASWAGQTLGTAQGSMGGVASTVAGKMGESGSSIGQFIANTLPGLLGFFDTSDSTATSRLSSMRQTTASRFGDMAGTTRSKGADMKAQTTQSFIAMALAASSQLPAMVANMRLQFQNAVSVAASMGQQIVSTLNGFLGSMSSSGSALVAGFAAGMQSNMGVVTSAAFAVAAAVRAAMPHSPAKKGPLSGLGYTTHSGRALVKDLAGGMMDNMHKVRAATNAIAAAANVGTMLDLQNDLGETGIVIDRREVNMTINNPVAEPTSRTVARSSNAIRLAGGI